MDFERLQNPIFSYIIRNPGYHCKYFLIVTGEWKRETVPHAAGAG